MTHFCVTAAVNLQSSHGRNSTGFRSESKFEWQDKIEAEEIICLKVKLTMFSLIPQTDGLATLRFETDCFNNIQDVINYLIKIESALTAHFGKTYQNAYYGTPFVEIDYFSLKINSRDSRGICIADSLSMKSNTPLSLNKNDTEKLSFNPIVSLYNDGLRSHDTKGKFLSWFTIIEEWLENNPELNQNFESAFTDLEKDKISEFGKIFGKRKHLLESLFRRTKMPRHEKLARILADLGVTEIEAVASTTKITPSICKEIIDDRHRLFHRGEGVNESRLYNLLFPLVSRIVELSPTLAGDK